jgi:WD40 repeat protein/serine/threonine protein kinase
MSQPMDAPSDREAVIFSAARRLPAGERVHYLDAACAGDPALHERVEELLRANDAAGDFLKELATAAPEDSQSKADSSLEATVHVSPGHWEKAGDRIGRYKLLQQIGEGGMGIVYMAEQEEPVRRRVALKIIKLGMDTKSVVARFEAERQALALMDHPNIARVLDGGATETGRPYFVMDLVQGVSITEFCNKAKLSTKERLKLFIQVCQAIQSAHQKGIIHRDIKPSNVLVTLHDGVPVPKVIDFGIAKATNQKLTEKTLFTNFASMIGTPAYMSPEQAELSGLDIDTRTDIYALGVLLYELLTGSTPFPEKRLRSLGYGEMQRVILEEEPERPSTRLSTMANEQKSVLARNCGQEFGSLCNLIRGDLDWIVMRCLEKDRTRRYETANGLAMDLQRHLSNEPVQARPPSRLYRLQKSVKRNKLAYAATGAVTTALVAGLGFSTWQFIEKSKAYQRAVAAEGQARKAQANEAELRKQAVANEQNALSAQRSEAQQRRQAEDNAYSASMLLAQADWDKDNIGHLRKVLQETRDYSERGFEWYYWQHLCHLEVATFHLHRSIFGRTGHVNCVAFSPDSQQVVSGSHDTTVRIWEASTGRELLSLNGHAGEIFSVTFSSDGQHVLTANADGTARLWEAHTGRLLLTLKGHAGRVFSVALAPDGQQIVTGSEDRTAKVWEARTGKELLTLKGHTDQVTSVALSPDGQRVVTASEDRTAKVWETRTGRELLTFKGHTDWLGSVAFSPDGRRILSSSGDLTAKVWEADTGRELLTLQEQSQPIASAVFSADGEKIVTGGRDGTVKVWEARTGRELFVLKGHAEGINSVAVSPDGQWIVSGSDDATAKVWKASADCEGLTLSGHTDAIRWVAFSLDGERLVTGSWDNTARVWEASTGRELLTLRGHAGPVWSVMFSPDGRNIVSGSTDRTAKLWEASTGRELLTLKGHEGEVESVAFSPEGGRIVTGSWDNTAKVWEATTGRELLTLRGHQKQVVSVAFSPDGERIVTGSWDNTAKVWEARTGHELLTLKGHKGRVSSVAVSPDGQRIVTGSDDRAAKVWDASTAAELLSLRGHEEVVISEAFSPDSQRIVTVSFDNTARLWDAHTGRELLRLNGHLERSKFSPASLTGRRVSLIQGRAGSIWSVAFSADGERIAIGSGDGTAKVWQGATKKQAVVWEGEARAAEAAAFKPTQADAGAIRHWLVLGPLHLAPGQAGPDGLDQEQVTREAELRPRSEDKAVFNRSALVWKEVSLSDYTIDFGTVFGRSYEFSVAYAVCYVVSDRDQVGLRLEVENDDEAKVYLNGKQVFESRGFGIGEAQGIKLKQGTNVLVFKVVNETGQWLGSIRFTDAAGQPVKRIRVTLDPNDSLASRTAEAP